ncbi:hypothetical protein Q9B79_16495 [Bacillus sp. MHSD_36]|uniref:hypothetical protein n=1 Tax=unclassified Bacillus (in: firmicutes) TaxID=185979 RepID=UPI0027422D11|nr:MULTISPECIES: hypothetical protein [unclassified Bacillus (in: firmicutes)]MDP7991390.1 hypothetical protein [Bacillus sp. MHSD_36]MDR4980264.1 hypothetical protein [Bacillus sp. MHSD_37]
MISIIKHHREEQVSVSVEEWIQKNHFLRMFEATSRFDFSGEKLQWVLFTAK